MYAQLFSILLYFLQCQFEMFIDNNFTYLFIQYTCKSIEAFNNSKRENKKNEHFKHQYETLVKSENVPKIELLTFIKLRGSIKFF